MPLPPVQPISTTEIYVSGDVTIHESAVIAPGTIIQAAPDSRIVIEARVCLGLGVIINACEGVIQIKAGAILGSGVLIIGQGSIGHDACIGATTTIFNASVEPMTVIPPGSLIGDTSRQITVFNISEPEPDYWDTEASSVPNSVKSEPETVVDIETVPNEKSKKASVVGQVYINQLLFTLFPERNNQ